MYNCCAQEGYDRRRETGLGGNGNFFIKNLACIYEAVARETPPPSKEQSGAPALISSTVTVTAPA